MIQVSTPSCDHSNGSADAVARISSLYCVRIMSSETAAQDTNAAKKEKSNVPKRPWFRFDSVPASDSQTRSPEVEKNELLPLYSFLGELINPTAAVTAKRGGPVRPDRLGTTV